MKRALQMLILKAGGLQIHLSGEKSIANAYTQGRWIANPPERSGRQIHLSGAEDLSGAYIIGHT